MNDMQRETNDAESKLQQLLSEISLAVKSDEAEKKVLSRTVFQSDTLRAAVREDKSPYEHFLPAFNEPSLDFSSRNPTGPVSLAIFMANAAPAEKPRKGHLETARSILEMCSGVPIALSVAGAGVSLLVRSGTAFDEACRQYLDTMLEEMALYPSSSFLDNAIRLSLTSLAAESEKSGGGVLKAQYSVSELYASLCVFEKQQFVPVSVLSRMWNVPDEAAKDICNMFSSMSLAGLSTGAVDGCEQCGLYIHELHLAYCKQIAAQSGVEREWHRRLLQRHDPITQSHSRDDFDFPFGVLPT